MKACTFFGHRQCIDDDLKYDLMDEIQRLYSDGVRIFYVGNQGQFDAIVLSALRQVKREVYSELRYAVVLAYHPGLVEPEMVPSETMFPEELEGVFPRYAIDRRNRWMVDHSDHVICWIRQPWGGAARYVNLARRKGKQVIEL